MLTTHYHNCKILFLLLIYSLQMPINHSNNTKQKLQVREWVNEWVRVVVAVPAAGVANVCVWVFVFAEA